MENLHERTLATIIKKINLCGGRPHPGLEREADTKVPLDAGEFPFKAVFAKC